MSDDLPFEYRVNVRTIGVSGEDYTYVGSREVMDWLVSRYGLISITSLDCRAVIEGWDEGYRIKGSVKARLTQPCSSTGSAIESEIDESFEEYFVSGSPPASVDTDSDSESSLDPFGSDPPQYFLGDHIDLAPLWLEFFALGYNPFVRSPSSSSESVTHRYGSDSQDSPFAVLKNRN